LENSGSASHSPTHNLGSWYQNYCQRALNSLRKKFNWSFAPLGFAVSRHFTFLMPDFTGANPVSGAGWWEEMGPRTAEYRLVSGSADAGLRTDPLRSR